MTRASYFEWFRFYCYHVFMVMCLSFMLCEFIYYKINQTDMFVKVKMVLFVSIEITSDKTVQILPLPSFHHNGVKICQLDVINQQVAVILRCLPYADGRWRTFLLLITHQIYTFSGNKFCFTMILFGRIYLQTKMKVTYFRWVRLLCVLALEKTQLLKRICVSWIWFLEKKNY